MTAVYQSSYPLLLKMNGVTPFGSLERFKSPLAFLLLDVPFHHEKGGPIIAFPTDDAV